MKSVILSITSIFIIILLFITDMSGQELPSFNHYYLNQYLYNPAMAGHNRYTEVCFITRQQWRGIDGAPVTSSLTLQLPTKSNLSFGVNLFTDKYGLLTNTSGLFTTAYTVQLSTESFLRGGVSIGMGRQSFNLMDLNAHEQNIFARSSYQANTSYLNGNAGLNYQWKKLSVGYVLPRIFQRQAVSPESFAKVKVAEMDYQLFLVSYNAELSSSIKIEPRANYRIAKGIPNQYEVLVTAFYKENIWMGVSYRQNNGPAFYLGGFIKEFIRVGYAHELFSGQIEGFSSASHEVMVSLRLGKKKENKQFAKKTQQTKAALTKNEKKSNKTEEKSVDTKNGYNAKPVAKTGNQSRQPGVNTIENERETGTAEENSTNQNLVKKKTQIGQGDVKVTSEGQVVTVDKPVIHNGEEKLKSKQNSAVAIEITQGHYVVVSAFRVYDNAVRYVATLKKRNIPVELKFSSKSLFYYVYVSKSQDLEEGRHQRDLARQGAFQDAWLLSVED
jgi:type IX secretion system PorP/SprF family membrane protein